MSADTPLGFTYPVGGDPVANLDTIVQALADRLDAHVGLHYGDRTNINFASVPSTQSASVTFPVGLFTTSANVMLVACVAGSSSPADFLGPTTNNVDTAGGVIWLRRVSGSTGNVPVHWHAMEIAP